MSFALSPSCLPRAQWFCRRHLAALFVALCAPVAAQSPQEWIRVQTMAQGHVLQAQAVSRPATTQPFTVNTLLDYSQPQHWGTKGERFLSSTAQWELNCSTGAYRALGFTAFADRMGQGAVVAQQSRPADWAAAPAASIPGELLRWACR